MTANESEFDPIGQIADEFVARLRRGEDPSITEYTRRDPANADRIRAVMSALKVVEKLKPGESFGAAGSGVPSLRPARVETMSELIGDYRIVREIGRGGMGVVYEAEQQSLRRRVALKLLPSHALQDQKARERFRREANVAAQLHHTNIVPVYDVGETEGALFYAMQFIDGRGLEQILQQRIERQANRTSTGGDSGPEGANGTQGPTSSAALRRSTDEKASDREPASATAETTRNVRSGGSFTIVEDDGWAYWRAVARIGIQVADALSYAHQRHVLHRDIKPSNLLLDPAGTVWITDFGLAKPAAHVGRTSDSLTETGDILGTIRYLAPERLRGIGDARSDIYGLGITLHEMLTLQPAFRGADRVDLIQKVARDEVPRPSSIDRRIPRDLETIVRKACDKEPARRYQTAAALAEDLRRFLELRPIWARDSSPAERAWWWCRRNPAIASSLFAVALLLVVIAAGATATALYLNATLDVSEGHRRRAEEAGTLAATEQKRAEAAEAERTEQLWLSLRNQAQAMILSSRPGQRRLGLEAIRQASAIRPSLELRNAAITCMSLPDLAEGELIWAATPEFSRKEWQFLPAGTDGLEVRELQEGVMAVIDCATGHEMGHVTGCLTPGKAWFSSDGKYLVLKETPHKFNDSRVEVWNWRVPKRVLEFVADPTQGLAFSPGGGECVVGAASGDLVFYDLSLGTEHHRVRLETSPPASRCCVYHPDAAKVITFLTDSQKIEFVDARSDRGVVGALTAPGGTLWVAVSPDGRFLAAACMDRRAYVWDLKSRECIRELIGHQAEVAWVSFVPGTTGLVTWSWDNTLRFWDLPTGQTQLRLPTGYTTFDTDGCRWASEINSVRRVQHLIVGREFRTLLGHTHDKGPTYACFHPDQPLLVSSGLDGLRIWDVAAGNEAGFLPGRFITAHFTPDGSQLLACGKSGVFCWPVQMDVAAQTLRIGPSRRLADASSERWGFLTADGRWLAATDEALNTVDLFEMPMGRRTQVFSGIARIALAVPSPDGRWCVGGTWPEKQCAIWDAQSRELVKRIDLDGPPKAAFNPEGTRLVVNDRQHGRIYSVPGWICEAEIPEHTAGGFGQPCYSPDGRILAMNRNGHLIQLLDATTLEELATLDVTQPLTLDRLTFSPDGTLLAAVASVNAVVLWDLRLVRERLAAMNLDWAHPAYPPPRPPGAKCPRIVIETAAPDRQAIRSIFRGALQ
jgi:serine/threonine protein kinase/WD40 repeat protein